MDPIGYAHQPQKNLSDISRYGFQGYVKQTYGIFCINIILQACMTHLDTAYIQTGALSQSFLKTWKSRCWVRPKD